MRKPPQFSQSWPQKVLGRPATAKRWESVQHRPFHRPKSDRTKTSEFVAVEKRLKWHVGCSRIVSPLTHWQCELRCGRARASRQVECKRAPLWPSDPLGYNPARLGETPRKIPPAFESPTKNLAGLEKGPHPPRPQGGAGSHPISTAIWQMPYTWYRPKEPHGAQAFSCLGGTVTRPPNCLPL